jgi:hypothetical protein
MNMKRCRVVKAHRRTYPDPLVVKEGDELTLVEKDEDYPGWIWCTDKNEKSGWVPEEFLEIDDESEGEEKTDTINRDYTALELNAAEGEPLNILEEVAGWVFCKNREGEKGWVPSENVELP